MGLAHRCSVMGCWYLRPGWAGGMQRRENRSLIRTPLASIFTPLLTQSHLQEFHVSLHNLTSEKNVEEPNFLITSLVRTPPPLTP